VVLTGYGGDDDSRWYWVGLCGVEIVRMKVLILFFREQNEGKPPKKVKPLE